LKLSSHRNNTQANGRSIKRLKSAAHSFTGGDLSKDGQGKLQRLRKAYVDVVHDDAEYSRQRWQLDIQLESPKVFDDVAPQIVSN